MPVMSGRLRSSRIRSALPFWFTALPSAPNRCFIASVPLVKETISLLTPERRMLRSIRRACPSSSSIMMMVTGCVIGRYSGS